jgi:hypothetical protein
MLVRPKAVEGGCWQWSVYRVSLIAEANADRRMSSAPVLVPSNVSIEIRKIVIIETSIPPFVKYR